MPTRSFEVNDLVRTVPTQTWPLQGTVVENDGPYLRVRPVPGTRPDHPLVGRDGFAYFKPEEIRHVTPPAHKRLTSAQALAQLQQLAADPDITIDPECAHVEADRILLATVPQPVRDAYEALRQTTGRFYYA